MNNQCSSVVLWYAYSDNSFFETLYFVGNLLLNPNVKKQLLKVRKVFNIELKILKITEPKMNLRLDSRTQKLLIGYSIYIRDKNNEDGVGKKRKNLYLGKENLFEDQILKLRFKTYIEKIIDEVQISIKNLGSEQDSLVAWTEKFTSNKTRYGNIELSEKTLKNGKRTFNVLIDYLNVLAPEMLNIWNWVGDGKRVLLDYLKHKQKSIQNPKLKYKRQWKNSTTKQNYNEIKIFFKWIHLQIEGFPSTEFLNIPLTPTKTKTSSFTQQEILKVKEFVNDKINTNEWGWFCKMLMVLMETGCRIKELEQMKIRQLNISDRSWLIHGKSRFGGKIRLNRLSEQIWNIIVPLISDSEGNLVKDKEYVFHKKYYRSLNNKEEPNNNTLTEDRQNPIPHQTFRRRFNLMVKELGLSKELTPHSCRRYYITEMLIKTNGNIPLIGELVGHSDWKTTQKYAKPVLLKDTKIDLGIFDSKGVSIPIMITNQMRSDLENMGYTKTKISSLKPEQAHEIIQRGF